MKEDRYASFWRDDEGLPHISERLRGRLVKAYKQGMNHKEAAIHCGIKHSNLLEYLSYDEEFRMRADGLREHLAIKAKMNVASAIEGGKMKSSQWYLERKRPEEFSTKQEVSVTNAESEENRSKRIEDALGKL